MIIVDSHCHTSPYWYEPVESLLHQMDENGVELAVLIQMNGQTNNDYQFECVRRYPGRFASVVIVDTDSPDATQHLAWLAERGASGVRLRPSTRSPGSDPLVLWRTAAELGLPVSCGSGCLNTEFASNEFAQLIESLPDLNVILEHMGSINQPDSEGPPYPLRQKVLSLARFPNVHVKIHGLGEFCSRVMPVKEPFPFEEPIPPLLDMVYGAFGAERMMWGSDFPPVSTREGYGGALRFTMDRFAAKSDEERSLIFGGVAMRLFRFDR